MAVMQHAIEHRGDRGHIAQQFAPVFHGTVGGQHGAGALVAAHDDLQQFFGGVDLVGRPDRQQVGQQSGDRAQRLVPVLGAEVGALAAKRVNSRRATRVLL